MAGKFRYYDMDQQYLLPPSLREWLPEDHLAFFISDVIEKLDLSDFESSYQSRTGSGAPAMDPRLLLKLLVYGYCVGVRASRKIERATYENVAFRVLTAEQHPDHDTIANFRRRHLEAFHELFVQILRLCQGAGLVSLGYVALDGTKIKANANKSKSRTYAQLLKSREELEEEVKRIVEDAEAQDREDDKKYGKKRGDELPPELKKRTTRLEKISKLIKQIEAEAEDEKVRIAQETKHKRQADEKWKQETGQKFSGRYPQMPGVGNKAEITESRRNPTDFDSRIMPDRNTGGYIQAYNCQAAVDISSQIIVAQQVVNQNNDKQLAPPMMEQTQRNTGSYPHRLAADCDYFSEADIADLQRKQIICYVPPKRGAEGKRLDEQGETLTNTMRKKLDTGIGKLFYRRRKTVVEPVFGQIKQRQNVRQFLVRGFDKVAAEWALITLAHNLQKLHQAAF